MGKQRDIALKVLSELSREDLERFAYVNSFMVSLAQTGQARFEPEGVYTTVNIDATEEDHEIVTDVTQKLHAAGKAYFESKN